MIVFLDTDILLDVALNRHPFAAASEQLLDALEKKPGHAYVAWHSISNFYYLVKSRKNGFPTQSFIRDLLQFVQIAPTNTKDVLYALRLPFSDFEDALQCAAAMASGADVIVSRNLKDYRKSPIPTQNPNTVLKMMLG